MEFTRAGGMAKADNVANNQPLPYTYERTVSKRTENPHILSANAEVKTQKMLCSFGGKASLRWQNDAKRNGVYLLCSV